MWVNMNGVMVYSELVCCYKDCIRVQLFLCPFKLHRLLLSSGEVTRESKVLLEV